MKIHKFLRMLTLLAVFLASCSPATITQVGSAAETNIPATVTPVAPAASPAVITDVPIDPAAPPKAVATSRGPNLVASDPATVNLASGGLQLVEFFRFT